MVVPVVAAEKAAEGTVKAAQVGAKATKAGVDAGVKTAKAAKKAGEGLKKTGEGAKRAGQSAKQAGQGAKNTWRAGNKVGSNPTPEQLRKRLQQHARRGNGNDDDKKKKRRPRLNPRRALRDKRQELGKQLRRQAGIPERSNERAVKTAGATARTGLRGAFRLTRKVTGTDRNQRLRKYTRRTVYIVLVIVALILYPLLTVWGTQPLPNDYGEDPVPVGTLITAWAYRKSRPLAW